MKGCGNGASERDPGRWWRDEELSQRKKTVMGHGQWKSTIGSYKTMSFVIFFFPTGDGAASSYNICRI
jgi:hypothetical protein